MEGDSRTSQEPAYHVDGTDTEYISGLSTLLAATIQETKESVSQIEYLFCKQLFPDFQSKLKKIHSEAKKAAEDEYKKKENDLMVQVNTLQSEKQKALEELQFLKMENIKVKKLSTSSSKHGNDLEEELKRKTKEIAEKRELQQSLRELLDSKSSLVHVNEKRLKELEDENRLLREKTHTQELELEELRLNLRCKSRIIEEKEESNCELLQLVQSKGFLIDQKDRQLKEINDKKNEILAKLEISEKKVIEKVESQETLLIKRRTQASEIVKIRKLLEDCENEKRLVIVKLKGVEEEIDRLKLDVRDRSNNESPEGIELHGKLLQQIEGKNGEIMIEKQKRREVVDAYKKLKSQYIYLCSKAGLNTENMIESSSKDVSKDLSGHDQNMLNSPVTGHPVCEPTNHTTNQQNSDSKKEIKPIQLQAATSSDIPKKVNLLSGTKRPVSNWRDTRPTKSRNGGDPHDDFLDTPLENIKEDLKKVPKPKQEIDHLPDAVPKDMNFESSDDETQDPTGGGGVRRSERKSFKYVEPVRKKADRANLKGVECKQCKKFYDAVLPDGGGNSKENLRCEHHEGVSRHRFRFQPPLTPEGFWNIGFESEM